MSEVNLPKVYDHSSVSSEETVMINTLNNVQQLVCCEKGLHFKIVTGITMDLRPQAAESNCTGKAVSTMNSNKHILHSGVNHCRTPADSYQMEENKNVRRVFRKSQHMSSRNHDCSNSGTQDPCSMPHHEPVSLFIHRKNGIYSRREYSLTSSGFDSD